MQTAELQPQVTDCATQFNNLVAVALLDARPIHARIHLQKNSHPAVTPLPHLLIVLSQDRNTHLGELICYFPNPAHTCAHRWISEEHISGTAAAGH
jgi:hypothetical protein